MWVRSGPVAFVIATALSAAFAPTGAQPVDVAPLDCPEQLRRPEHKPVPDAEAAAAIYRSIVSVRWPDRMAEFPDVVVTDGGAMWILSQTNREEDARRHAEADPAPAKDTRVRIGFYVGKCTGIVGEPFEARPPLAEP